MVYQKSTLRDAFYLQPERMTTRDGIQEPHFQPQTSKKTNPLSGLIDVGSILHDSAFLDSYLYLTTADVENNSSIVNL